VNNYMSKPGSLFRVSLVIIPLLSVQARVVCMFTVTPTLAQAFAPCYISTTKTSLSSSSTSIITSNSSSSGSSKLLSVVVLLIITLQATLSKIYSEMFKKDLSKMLLISLLIMDHDFVYIDYLYIRYMILTNLTVLTSVVYSSKNIQSGKMG